MQHLFTKKKKILSAGFSLMPLVNWLLGVVWITYFFFVCVEFRCTVLINTTVTYLLWPRCEGFDSSHSLSQARHGNRLFFVVVCWYDN